MTESSALQKLVHVLGRSRAEALTQETLRKIGRPNLADPESRLLFGHALTHHGGVIEAIGRAIKIQAILQGAEESVLSDGRNGSG